jgi:extradiol dioxygenase family protein
MVWPLGYHEDRISRTFSMATLSPFHLAFPVTSLAHTRSFYGELLGCPEGRSCAEWIDFDFFGHQIVAHLDPCGNALEFKAFADRSQLFAK